MTFRLILFLILFHVSSYGQVVLVTEFRAEHLHASGTLNRLLKQNSVTRDSLLDWINNTLARNLIASVPGLMVKVADTSFYQLLSDSVSVKQMLTTSHIKAVEGMDPITKIGVRINDGPTFYTGKIFTPGGIIVARELMTSAGADYFLIPGKVKARSKFSIEYEVYDRNFVKLAGNKFERKMTLSGNMYWKTFTYYLEQTIQAFSKEVMR